MDGWECAVNHDGLSGAHLTKQVSFGPRPSGSAALNTCRQYIVSELRKIGIDVKYVGVVLIACTGADLE